MAQEVDEAQHNYEDYCNRLQERFSKEGLEHFQSHEALALLLQYAQPKRNANELAQELLNKFDSLHGVLDASYDALLQVNGVNFYTATLLKLLPSFCEYYMLSKTETTDVFNTKTKIEEYLRAKFISATCEKVLLLCLDESGQMIGCREIARGTTDFVQFNQRDVILYAMQKNSTRVILAHNHPCAKAEASQNDLYGTKQLQQLLQDAGIELVDHFVVGSDGKVLSLRTRLQCLP